MRKLVFSMVVLTTFVVMGCGPALSLHPLCTDKDMVFNPVLVGRWVDKDGEGDDWIFRQLGENLYTLTIKMSKGDSLLPLEGRLIQLGEYTFMDVTSREADVEDVLAIPVHAFLRLSLEGDSLGMAYLDESFLEKNNSLIKNEVVDGQGIILTASTKELQDFVLKHAEDKEAFEMAWCHRK